MVEIPIGRCRKGLSHGKPGNRVVGERMTRTPKGLWDSCPRKRARRNPKEETWEKYLLKERLRREKENEL